ncbi:MAG: SDR family oxidoreductase [Deltaproteobacteria bacterium]|nr:MAG: SDR family oxidoreductase [Deltaproteobacteria bacterium]
MSTAFDAKAPGFCWIYIERSLSEKRPHHGGPMFRRSPAPFAGHAVFLTGGASGIGRALAVRLVAQGADVVLADWDGPAAAAVAEELGCHAVEVDVRDPDAVRRAVAEARALVGPIDLLINNAGVVQCVEAHLADDEDWRRVIDVDLYGVVHGVQAVYPEMVARGRGHIVNIASVAGLFPSAGQVSYTAAKHGVVGLSYALRAEAKRHGVSVTVICPGIVKTAMRDDLPVRGVSAERLRALLPAGADVDQVADRILDGVARDRVRVVVTPMAHLLTTLMRIHPGLGVWLNRHAFDLLLRRASAA